MKIEGIGALPPETAREVESACAEIAGFCPPEKAFIPHFRCHPEPPSSPVVSIIIPVCNSGFPLIRMLDSVVNQKFADFEIICVDDGSSDNSPQILKGYAALDRRIRILEQDNKGGGAARNAGLQQASGKYIAFMDADDFCSDALLADMVARIQRDQADLVVSRKCNYNVSTGKYHETPFPSCMAKLPHPFAGRQCGDHLYAGLYNAPWGKLFSAEFIRKHDLQFQEIRNSNDLYFGLMTASLAERISLLDRPLYYYCIGSSDGTQATKWRDPLLFLEALRKTEDELRKRGLYTVFESAFRESMVLEFVFNFQTSRTEDAFRQIFDAAKKYFDAEFFATFPISGCLDRDAWQNLHDMMQFDSPFQFLLDRYCRQVQLLRQATSELENSRSYRIGQAITWLPRRIRDGIARKTNPEP